MTAKEVRKNPARTFLSLLVTGLFVAGTAGLVTAAPAAAQTGAITGTITSAQTGEPLSAAQVSIEGTGLGTLTQANGKFLILRVPAGTYTVNAILIGFASSSTTVTVSDGESAVADIRLAPQAISLSEIVVTGVAGATQRTKLPFDVTQVRVADLPVPQSNAAQALQGKVAGATVVQGSGRPGSAPSILLRGVTSLDASGRDQEPLYIVDGVIMSSSMVDLDALDIESIEVVKGAAAASLYGSRAGNGVIQIRTKRGAQVADDQVRYTFRNEYGGSNLAYVPEDLLAKKHRFALSPDGTQFVDNDGTYCNWLECSQPRESGADAWSTYQENPWPGQTFDQVQRFFTNGNYLQSNLSAEGRSGRTNFHVSASRLDQEGVLRFTPGFKRTNFRVNVDQSVVDNLTIQSSVFYSKSTQGNGEGPLFDLTRMPAGIDLLAPDPNHPGDVILGVNPTDSESDNPIYELQHFSQTQARSRFLGSANGRYSPTDWLNIDGNFSFDRLDRNDEYLRNKGYRCTEPCTTFTSGTLEQRGTRDEALNASITASAHWNVADQIRNTTQVRYLYENDDYHYLRTYGYGFAVGNVPVFDNIDQDNVTAGSTVQTVRADGYFLITNFDMYDKYVIDGLIRNDGSSLFGADERRQWYYRIAGAWRLGQEDFFKIPGVDEFKLRYAIGTAGGRPRFEAQYETYNVSGGIISPVSLGNKNLKPEFSTEHEAGLDMSLFNSKVTANLTYAFNTTKDQILPVPQPSYTGFQTQWRNAGTVESKTWEATLDFRLLERTSFNWSAKFLYDHTTSTITELTEPPFVYGVGGQGLGSVFYAREGEKVGTYYGGIFARGCGDLPSGVSCDGFQVDDNGFLVWTGGSGFDSPQWGTNGPAVNGSTVKWGTPFAGVCTDRTTGEETRNCPVGNTMPDYNMGISTTMTIKGLSLYALVNRSAGFDVYNQPLQWGFFKRATHAYDQDVNAPANQKKPLGYYDAWYSGTGGLVPSNEFVEDGSFTKLREVSLSYRLRKDQLGSVPGLNMFQGIGISVTGRNLFTWTNYRGYDPETGVSGGDTGSAAVARVDGYSYPNFRTWTAALELIF